MKHAITLVLVAACGSSNTGGMNTADGSNQQPADAKVFSDTPPSVPAMITISGVAGEGGSGGSNTPKQGAAIVIYASDNDSMLGMATTDAQGHYAIQVTTGGHAVDGYVKATLSSYKETYVYAAGSWTKDSTADINLITTGNFGLLSAVAGASQDANKGTIALVVADASSMPVMGATVATTPASGAYRYFSGGLPSSSATSTDDTGLAFIFNVPPEVTVSAMKSGLTIKSHVVKARAGAFTQTVVTE